MASQAVSAAGQAAALPSPRPVFHGDGGTLLGIQILNSLLSMLTLGVYFFWGKAKVRRYLFNQVEVLGDRFAYHGTGQELFLGFLKAVIMLGSLWAGMVVCELFFPPGKLVIVLAFFCLVPVALYGSMRFFLSRTSWRGIRFSFRGDLKECFRVYLSGALLTALTLGFYFPFFRTKMKSYWINHSYVGNTRFEYDGEGRDLFGSFVATLLLTLPTLYLSWLWYAAKEQRYDWGHTRLAGGRFESDMKGGELFALKLGNLLLLVFTFGLAYPWVIVRNVRFVMQHIAFSEWPDVEGIQRTTQEAVSAVGEGLAEALDVDLAI